MLDSNDNDERRELLSPAANRNNFRELPAMPLSERRPRNSPQQRTHTFHVIHNLPSGHSPYVKAKQVQLIEKDPSRAISLFWAAINSGDRVESALKDMAVVMKQLDRSEEAIEAIKSFRHLCPHESQDSLDNVLLELYKSSGRIQEEIEMLQLKLKHIEEGITYGGKQTKIARSQGRKFQITIEKEYSRLLGKLAWVFMQQKDYKSAEEFYRKALSLEPDKNKQCNLAICLIHLNKIVEAKILLRTVQFSADNGIEESCAKSFERALQMIDEIESQSTGAVATTSIPRTRSFCCNTTSSVVFDSTGNKKAVAYESSPYPLTQPRRRQATLWSSNRKHGREIQSSSSIRGQWSKQNSYQFSRKLSFEQPVVPLEPANLKGEEDCSQGPSDLKRSLDMRENLQPTQLVDKNPKPTPHTVLEREESMKSWADMVEEDEKEQEKEQSMRHDGQTMHEDEYSIYRTPSKFSECYKEQLNDENGTPNVIVDTDPHASPDEPKRKDAKNIESPASGDLECGGYYTQPGNHVRRSLTFQDENVTGNTQTLSSPLNKPTYASVLSGMMKLLSRSSSSSKRSRLQVFRDIAPQSPTAF